jgi:hypothetical protein
LFEFQKKRYDVLLKANYEYYNNLYVFSSFQFIHNISFDKKIKDETVFQLGFSYGLP